VTGELRVGGTQIDAAVAGMTSGVNEIERILAELTASLDLLSSQWTGEAQRAYARAQADWNRSMEALHAELRRVRDSTQLSNETFSAAERSVRQMWSA
jgi:WXG100 family type VII secretion target